MKSDRVKSGVLQLLAHAAFLLAIGYLSTAPRYSSTDPQLALLRVSISHAGERAQPCRRYSPEEIAQMAPNMRRAMDCARERVALRLQLEVDGETVMDESLSPSGLSSDGPSSIYARFSLVPGTHTVVARMRDTRRAEGFDHEGRFELQVGAGESRVLAFRPRVGGFKLL